jgi:hypothetical protein
MRPRHPHAAESGVGKHTARESERVQACAAGKERVTNAHPHKLAPEAARPPEPFSFSDGFELVADLCDFSEAGASLGDDGQAGTIQSKPLMNAHER